MTRAIVDTTLIIHLFRRNTDAQTWLASQGEPLSITPITWLEVMYGAPGKAGQAACETILAQFEMVYLTRADMDWAMQKLKAFRLSHGASIMDCLIASVAYRLQVPLYTHNLRDMQVLLESLAVKPY